MSLKGKQKIKNIINKNKIINFFDFISHITY